MNFIKSLSDQLQKATGQGPPWGDVNPLIMIGLTEAVLDLGLTEDQMYPVVRGFLRQLAAQVHPDRKPTNVSRSRQQEILAALNYLDDRENFGRALDDFRTLKTEDRREVRLLSQTVDALRRQNRETDQREAAVRTERESLRVMQDAFRKQKNEEPLKVPQLEKSIRTLTTELKRTETTARRETIAHRTWLRRFKHLELYLSNLGNRPFDGPPFHPLAFDAKWVVVAFLSYEDNAQLMAPLTKHGRLRSRFLKAVESAGIPDKRIPEVIAAWKEAVTRFKRPDEAEKQILNLTIAVLKLSGGYPTILFGDRLAGFGRVIGSMTPYGNTPLVRKNLATRHSRTSILEETLPFLIPGRMLISFSKERRRKAPAPLDSLYGKSLFHSRRVILAAG